MFWLVSTKIVVTLDDEKPADHVYGNDLAKKHPKFDMKVFYMKPYPAHIIHNWGKTRMYLDMLHADNCTGAEFVGFVDVDTLFIIAVTPSV